MEPSKGESSEGTVNHGGTRPESHARWADTSPMERTVRALLGVEAASFVLATVIHAGVFIPGYEHREAMIAESVIGTVLLTGLAMALIRSRSMFSIAASVQAFALVGTLVGLWTIIVGVGPQTIPDIVYHAVIVPVLTIGLVVAWHARETGGV